MPEKTHAWSWQLGRALPPVLFELHGGAVVQRRVQASAIVIALQKMLDLHFQIGTVAILAGVDFLLLESFDKAFAFGIVVGIARTAPAGQNAMVLKHAYILAAGILDSAMGMMNQAQSGPPQAQCSL